MIFYHYTCLEHLEEIVGSGYLKLCESNAIPPSYVVETTVVWLYKKPVTGRGPTMLQTQSMAYIDGKYLPVTVDKTRVEITVDVPASEVQRADKFFKRHKTPAWWLKILEAAGGSSKLRDWYVIERIIP